MAHQDKRTVTTDALETLGTIITEKEGRDAIHLAVENVVAGHTLAAGDDVGFLEDGTVGTVDKPVGIVDPFLKSAVKKGQRFWLVVYPRQITSLRHVWEHPDFPKSLNEVSHPTIENALKDIERVQKSNEIIEAENYIQNLADKIGVTYNELMDHAGYQALDGSHYWSEGGRFEGEWIPEEFWDYYETVTGKKIPRVNKNNFLSCSC